MNTLARKAKIAQEERRQLRPPSESGLPIGRHGMLPDGSLAPAGGAANRLVAFALEQSQGHLLLSRRQPPGCELIVHGATQSVEGLSRPPAPGVDARPDAPPATA